MRVMVKVVPRSSRNEVVGEMDDGTLKVKLTAAPVDGKANEALLKILSEYWGCRKDTLKIISGKVATKKLVERFLPGQPHLSGSKRH